MKATKNLFITALTLAAFTTASWTQTSTDSAKPAPKHRHAAAVPAQPAATAADVQALKDALAAQQQQIQQLTQQLQQNQQTWQQAQSAAAEAASKAAAAQDQASQQQQAVGQLKTDVADLRTNVTNTAVTLQDTQKSITALDTPTALHFRGITITPGGYLAAEFVHRQRALGADVSTPLNSIPMPGASQNSLSEFFGTGRTSRISLLTEGKLKNAKLSGYYEADFLSAGVTSTSNSTNSYTLRQRQAYAQAAFDNGWTFTGGQQWSLITETGHGLDNRTEAVPTTIDTAYSAGFSYNRQYGLRVVKNISNKVWFGFAVENAQATVTTHTNAANWLVGALGDSKSYNTTATYSFNPSPDLVAKLAFEPGFGHYEVFGLFSRFRDRVFPCVDVTSTTVCGGITGPNSTGANNVSRNGGGIGANARWTFANKHVVFGLHGLGGSGIGRYGTGGLPDSSVYANGSLHLIRNFQGLGTLEWHGSKLDIYTNAGVEYAARTADFDPTSGKEVGYGAPLFANNGCYSEPVPGTTTAGFTPGSLGSCTADTRALIEGTAGFWYRFYNGPKGKFQYGTQFSYVTRNAWSGSGTPNEPHGVEPMVMTSFRYYLP
jgi:hypothetical protein